MRDLAILVLFLSTILTMAYWNNQVERRYAAVKSDLANMVMQTHKLAAEVAAAHAEVETVRNAFAACVAQKAAPKSQREPWKHIRMFDKE